MRAVTRFVVAATVTAASALLLPVTPADAVGPRATAVRAAVLPVPGRPGTYKRFAPNHYTPPAGPKFNNPYGTKSARRALLSHVIRTINSSPGYRLPRGIDPSTGKKVACPTDPKYYPSVIKIALYSIADRSFVDALINAHRRCVSVQLLMNSHLNVDNSPSWRRLVNNIPVRSSHWRTQRSFVHRCSNGCIGSTVLHTKFYLFSRAASARKTVMVGSSNMTSNAVHVQWNDLFTVRGLASLYDDYTSMFEKMVPDVRGGGPRIYQSGPYTSTFYPFRRATRTTDKTMQALQSIRCSGATGGAGIGGHTVVYIAMHAWHGTRGLYLAKRVRQMYDRGCYIRILYSFMGHNTYSLLTHNTGSRMVARRVLFAGANGIATKYSHMKLFAASGNVGGDTSNWVSWTGSNNWADRSIKADEVTIRIPSRSVYNAYVKHWNFMRARRSSGTWAIYPEPGGGGRVPD
jgi:phosphatidylserine/phosphatidylglycerophosphate/cardiolipin synthase-like enzyme